MVYNFCYLKGEKFSLARVVELVDTRDLKSLDRNIVPVQVRPRVPLIMPKRYNITESLSYKNKLI